MLKKLKEFFMPTPVKMEEEFGVGAVTETDQWDYILFGGGNDN